MLILKIEAEESGQEEIDNEVEAVQNIIEETGELEEESYILEYDVSAPGESQSTKTDREDESGSAEILIDPTPDAVITAPTSGPKEDFLSEGSGDFLDFGSGAKSYFVSILFRFANKLH